MTDDRWQRIKDLFGEASELPTQLRRGFLDEACAGDQELQSEVEGLLSHHTGTELSDEDPEPEREGAGAVIDRYRLLEPIGEGGMGEVWMAEQLRPVKRKVAIKIIKLGMDTAEVVARFEAERQALALMDHAHIAKVLDGGATEGGRPFFVMELVKGVPITDWCDEAGLDTEGRLALFRQVCRAVQHAHTRGIIHRDIKPSNVLVTLHDGEPVPKVIDFGIAKAVDQELTERTCFTRYRQVVGTPESMAPEQAEMSGLDVDARADIYSLGVLLYELLTGTKPFDPEDLREAGYVEMLRTIREVDPPKPSTRLTTLGEKLSAVASRRGALGGSLTRQLSGDLDWIVMKCLEKDRTRRYETASSLAADVGRHLDCEPVEAGPPSAIYRFGKFARRRRGAVVAASLLVIGLGVGFAAAATSYQRMHTEWEQSLSERELALSQREEAEVARRLADDERRRSERMNSFLTGVIGGTEPAVARNHNVAPRPSFPADTHELGALLDDAARRVEVEFSDDPEIAARLRTTIGRGFVHRGMWAQAGEYLPEMLADTRAELGEDAPWVVELQDEMTDVLVHLGRGEDAVASQVQVVELLRRNKGGQHPETVAAVGGLASVYLKVGRPEDAERVLGEVLFTAPRAPTAPASPFGHGTAEAPHSKMTFRFAADGVGADRELLVDHQGFFGTEEVYETENVFGAAEAYASEDIFVGVDGGQRFILRSADGANDDAALIVEHSLLEERIKAAWRPGAMASEKNAAAWALLTTPTVELRDPVTALHLATEACEATGHGNPVFLDTLSLALHRDGRTEDAIENQRVALGLVAPTRTLLIADMQRALAVFEGRLPEEQLHERRSSDG
jgi:hypothetical protein